MIKPLPGSPPKTPLNDVLLWAGEGQDIRSKDETFKIILAFMRCR